MPGFATSLSLPWLCLEDSRPRVLPLPQPVVMETGGSEKLWERIRSAGARSCRQPSSLQDISVWEGASASTSRGPMASRQNLCAQLSKRGGFPDPFHLTTDEIYSIMGALKAAQYRSADQYEAAKALHIAD